MKRVFLIVLDSVGIGEAPDADEYGDKGSNTLKACASVPGFNMPNMKSLGLFNIDGINCKEGAEHPEGSFARMQEVSKGKDTTTGHWEISGLYSESKMPTFPQGFPEEIIEKISKITGRKVLCNKPYSGTKVIEEYGKQSMDTGALIVYTSADSVLQIAAHEDVIPVEELYKYCRQAREILTGRLAVGRVIARPFIGKHPNFTRTPKRHDFSLDPPGKTMLDLISSEDLDVISVGKINDIFNGKGITEKVYTSGNAEGIDKTVEMAKKNFGGLCFVNLVDFDMLYGHRNDAFGYAEALSYFDSRLPEIRSLMNPSDIMIITADHGCDPSTESTDHSREYTPMLIFGDKIKHGVNLGTREGFYDISATILEYLGVKNTVRGNSFLGEVLSGEV